MQPYLILVGMIILGYVTKNTTVSLASALLLVLKIVLPQDKLVYFGGHGLWWGVILLTAAVLTPMAQGKIGMKEIMDVFKSPEGMLSVAIGVVVALFGRWGTDLMARDPQIVVSSIVGTIIGVVFLRGVAVGPMIASGIVYMLMKIFHVLFQLFH